MCKCKKQFQYNNNSKYGSSTRVTYFNVEGQKNEHQGIRSHCFVKF